MTTDALPAVALLFDDAAQVAPVRDALTAAGARIVHEGPLAALTAEALAAFRADVLVINLDERALEALDRVYALLGSGGPRIVFNDVQASAGLTGWDRARWARHLAAKVLAAGGVDPPRPAGAVEVDVQAARPATEAGDAAAPAAATGGNANAPAPSTPSTGDADAAAPVNSTAGGANAPSAAAVVPGLADATDDAEAALTQQGQDEAAALSAELEALLASEAEGDADAAGQDGADDGADAADDLAVAPAPSGPVSLEDLETLTAPPVPEAAGESGSAALEPADAVHATAPQHAAAPVGAMDATNALDTTDKANAPDAPDTADAADATPSGLDVGTPLDAPANDAPVSAPVGDVAIDPGLEALLRAMPDAGAGDVETTMGTGNETGATPGTQPARGLDDMLSTERTAPADAAEDRPGGSGLSTLELVAPGAYGNDAAPGPARVLDDLLHALPPNLAVVKDGVTAPATPSAPEIKPPEAPAEWALLGDDEIAPLAAEPVAPETFGVAKMSAEDFLAPDAAAPDAGDEPVLNLELVSMEEAVVPRPVHASIEMHLDELHMALSRLVLTGCTLGGTPAAEAFYAALPADTRLTFVHTQHLRGRSAEELVAQLAQSTALRVRLATEDSTTQPGEVLVVPPGQEIRVHRDGRVELKPMADEQGEPSIDASFRMAAEGFGRDALAIVFSGHGSDSVAGAKAIHDAGGQVWVEITPAEYADMVNEIAATGAVDVAASPAALAARLVETQA